MDTDLKIAATRGDIDMLYNLIQGNPNILDFIDDVPFVETPLHTAASHGKIPFAKEMIRLKPTFARKLNQQGFTPLHLALFNGQTKMALQFLNHESGGLVRVQGREGKTPLHEVVEQGDLVLLTNFLSACPTSIQDVTIHGETALHIAVENEKVEALDMLLAELLTACYKGSDLQENIILNWKDNKGRTALHLAATKDQDQLVRLLLDCEVDVNSKDEEGETALHIATAANGPQIVRMLVKSGIKVNAKNSRERTALDVLNSNNEDVERILLNAGALKAASLPTEVIIPCISCHDHHRWKSKLPFYKRDFTRLVRRKASINQDTINVMVVVAALILTSTYQAVLSPPGGFWQDNSNSDNNNGNRTINIIRAVNTSIFSGTNNASATTFIINLNDVNNGGNSNSSSKAHRAGKFIMSQHYSSFFYGFNTFALLSAGLLIVFLMPDPRKNYLLFFPVYQFLACYVLSLGTIDPAGFWRLPLHSGLVLILALVSTLSGCFVDTRKVFSKSVWRRIGKKLRT